MRMLKACALLSVLLSLAPAQTWRGAIRGTILDASESHVSGAVIRIVSNDQGKIRTTHSDATGEFTMGLLPPGDYRVEVEHPRFSTSVETVTVAVNQDVRLDLRLQAGQRNDQVNVTAHAELLKTESPALSTVVDNRTIRQIPLDGRNFYELSLLAPGTVPAAQGS